MTAAKLQSPLATVNVSPLEATLVEEVLVDGEVVLISTTNDVSVILKDVARSVTVATRDIRMTLTPAVSRMAY
jgi:hypothetical protein